MYINREMKFKVQELAQKYPVLAITGPRQSGKTTMVKNLFPVKSYVSMENPDNREFANSDPRGFLATYREGAVIDEAQKTPQLFSYIQTEVDERQTMGRYILTGSQNFLLLENVTQSLAGRVALLKLLPFSYGELQETDTDFKSYENLLFTGTYPGIYDRTIDPVDFYPNYIQTYIERDVRSIQNIQDLGVFQTFLKLCAGRIGQLLNISSLASDCGISQPTAKQWLNILEASYIIFRLQPHHVNYNKRLTRMPKLYFYDTGLACSLLSITSSDQVISHYNRGALFENMVITELIKNSYNAGREHKLYFWRDKNGNEVDILIDNALNCIPVEIKSGKTIASDYFTGLNYWRKISGSNQPAYLVYGGAESQKRTGTTVMPWNQLDSLFALQQ